MRTVARAASAALLLAHGGAASKRDEAGWTPLLWASVHGHERCVRLLLDHSVSAAEARPNGCTALMHACFHGHLEAVEVLLQAKADASMEASYGVAGFGASFKASGGYKQAANEAKQSSFYRFDSTSYCNKYLASWLHKVPDGSELTPQFAETALEALEGLKGKAPKEMTTEEQLAVRHVWFDLFGVYGTHQSHTRCSDPSESSALCTTEITALCVAQAPTSSRSSCWAAR